MKTTSLRASCAGKPGQSHFFVHILGIRLDCPASGYWPCAGQGNLLYMYEIPIPLTTVCTSSMMVRDGLDPGKTFATFFLLFLFCQFFGDALCNVPNIKLVLHMWKIIFRVRPYTDMYMATTFKLGPLF